MPQSIYKKSLFVVCCGFVLALTIAAILLPPQCEPVRLKEGLAAEAPARAVPKATLLKPRQVL